MKTDVCRRVNPDQQRPWRLARNTLPVAIALAISSIGGLLAPAAQAQPVREEGLVTLEEVIVTARRREEVLQDIPIAITAFDSDDLREQNITELSDLGIHVPSFRISDVGVTTSSPLVTLRGQRPSDIGLTADGAIPIYFAEVPLTPNQGTNLAMYDLANVQVLKGPQGTLFGRNSTGGALLITPQAPGAEFGGYGQVTAGDYDLLHVEGAVDLPASDTLQFRIAGRSIDRDGYQDNVADNALNDDKRYWDEDSYGFRFSVAWAPTDRLTNNLVASYDENDIRGRVPVPMMYNHSVRLSQLIEIVHNGGSISPFPGQTKVDDAIARQQERDDPFKIESDVDATEKVENIFVVNNTEFELTDDLRIRNIFGYRDLDYNNNTHADGTAVQLFGAITSTTEEVTPNPPVGDLTATQYSNELQLLGESFDSQLEWIVGAFWMDMDGSQFDPQVIGGANPDWPEGGIGIPQLDVVATEGFINLPNIDATNKAYALFSEGTWTFNEQWALTAGLRQSWDDREMVGKSRIFSQTTLEVDCAMFDEDDNQLPNDNCSRKVDEDFDKMTWRTAVSYTPVDAMLLYGSISTGYRSGGFNSRGQNNFTLEPFDEETVLTYEVGHKTDWELFDFAAMRTNLAVYLQEYDDIQKSVAGSNPDTGAFETFTINAAQADIWGVEFDVLVAPTANLSVSLGWSYVDTEYNEWERVVEQGPQQGETVDYSQSKFEWIPKHSLNGSVTYTLPLDPAIGDVSLNAYGYWQDDMDTNDDAWIWPSYGWAERDLQAALDSAEVDAYAVWNFRADWRGVMGSSFDVAAFVNNAFDEEYPIGGLTVPESLGWVGFSYGPPRVWGGEVRYSF